MNVTRLLIARHGNTFGPGEPVTRLGITDKALVTTGLEQGKALGHYLKNHDLIPDAIFTSRLKRTAETAAEAQKAMGTKIVPQSLAIFDEIDYGPDENQPEDKVVARLGLETLEAWDQNATVPKDWKIDPCTIIQSWKNFAAQWVKDYSGKTALIVTSNGIARFAPHLTGDFADFRAQHNLKISTGALCIFEFRTADRWHCIKWNLKPTRE